MVKLMKVVADAHHYIANRFFKNYVLIAHSALREISLGSAYHAYGCYYLARDEENLKRIEELIRLLEKNVPEDMKARAIRKARGLERKLKGREEFSRLVELSEEDAEYLTKRFIKESIAILNKHFR